MADLILSQFQSLFSDAILRRSQDPQLLRAVTPGGALAVPGSMEVYRRAYRVRLTEALGETFEAVWWVLGDEGFFDLATRFIRYHPSQSYNLSDYGEDLPQFLEASPESDEFPFLAELARFEWVFKKVFHARQHPSITREAIEGLVHVADARLEFGESVQLFESRHAVHDLWNQRGIPHEQQREVELNRPQHLLLYKKEKQVRATELDRPQFEVLRQVKVGLTLTEAMGRALDQSEDLPAEVISTLFQLLFHIGVISKIVALR